MSKALKLGRTINDKPSKYEDWEQETSAGFDQADVCWWYEESEGQCSKIHQSCLVPSRIQTQPLDLEKARLAAGLLEQRRASQSDSEAKITLPSPKLKSKKPVRKVVQDSSESENAAIVLKEDKLAKKRLKVKPKRSASSDSDRAGDAVVRLDLDSDDDTRAPAPPAPPLLFVMPSAGDTDDELDKALANLSPAKSCDSPSSVQVQQLQAPSKPIDISDSSEAELVTTRKKASPQPKSKTAPIFMCL